MVDKLRVSFAGVKGRRRNGFNEIWSKIHILILAGLLQNLKTRLESRKEDSRQGRTLERKDDPLTRAFPGR